MLVLTPGMGIGPEVTAQALAIHPLKQPVLLLGDRTVIGRELTAVGLEWTAVDTLAASPHGVTVMQPESEEPVEVAAIRTAAEACLAGHASAMVTGPIHKQRLVAAGFGYRGHTDFLGAICSAEPVMAFVGGELRVALVTTHVPLAQVPALITAARVHHVAQVAAAALVRDLGLAHPRLAICGLNPHAGEGGLLGTEEQQQISPAIDALQTAGVDARGPVSAETAFLQMRAGEVDLVVAMYHDQGLAPLKAVDFGRSVNWTLGLPLIRTSVDHGTADALVGTGEAKADSMVAAISLAERILHHRAQSPVSATSPVSPVPSSRVLQS
jgi:4-hydroxythreonine-4-phosphate dehydrogenase